MGGGVQRHASAALLPGKDPLPVVEEGGWAPGPVWEGSENLAPTGIPSPDRPACSESLYRLSYPGPPEDLEFYLEMLMFINIRIYAKQTRPCQSRRQQQK
jgi:hypothetical protein